MEGMLVDTGRRPAAANDGDDIFLESPALQNYTIRCE